MKQYIIDAHHECVYFMCIQVENKMNPSFIYDNTAPKRATNLSVNSNLLEEAKAYKINLSKLLEVALVEKLTEKKRTEWLEQNLEALESYNQRVEERGVFSDGLRTF